MTLTRTLFRGVVLLLAALTLGACSGWDPGSDEEQRIRMAQTIERFKTQDPEIQRFFDNAHGYAIFSTVGKGAIGVGGAYGQGEVYQSGRAIGSTELIQLTIGFQWGGQAYSEIIFFEDANALERFKGGKLKFSAQASAVAVTAGASATADYENGVAVFTLARGGLMYEASIGGQSFSFEAY